MKKLNHIYTMWNDLYNIYADISQDEKTGRYYAIVRDSVFASKPDLQALVDKMSANGFRL